MGLPRHAGAAASSWTAREVAREWFDDEYMPVVECCAKPDLLGSGTEADAYLRVAHERYRLLRTHEWNDDVIERLRA